MASPEWLTLLCSEYLNLGFLDSNALGFFGKLCESVVTSRQEEKTSHDFLQNLVDRIVEARKGDPDTEIDSFGNSWSRKGKKVVEIYESFFISYHLIFYLPVCIFILLSYVLSIALSTTYMFIELGGAIV